MDFLFRAYQEEDECGWYRDLRIDAMDEFSRQLLGLVRFLAGSWAQRQPMIET